MIKDVEFKTPNNEVLQETNLVSLYDTMPEKIVKESEDFGGKESGWILNEILRLEVRTNRYSPFQEKIDLLLRKGVFPYDYFDSFEKFKDSCLPPIRKFYKDLNEEAIRVEDYNHA
ncbi:hypothetical protein NPIL_159341, partial [Nephila pilipes]